MELAEYATMAEVEERHWWYRALRAVITEAWTRHVQGGTAPALLDVGCGTGANLLALRDRARPCGIDFSPEAVHWCRSRGLAATAVASAASLPFGPERFDVVLSCDVLCHGSLPDKEAPLAEMARVLKPGGVLHVATDHAGYAEWIDELVNVEPTLEYKGWPWEDAPLLTDRQVITKFEGKGLDKDHVIREYLWEKK